MKNEAKRWLLMTVVFLVMLSVWPPIRAFASVPYPTYTLNGSGQFVFTQTSYIPTGVITGNQIPGTSGFSSPDDIYIHGHKLYVADTYNSRVVVFNLQGKYLQTIGASILSQPKGLFVDASGNIYVADSGNNSVYKFNPKGHLIYTYNRPTSPLFGSSTPYVPEKVVVNNQGNLFIVSSGSVQGLIELSQQGVFEGFFGGNIAGFNLARFFERIFYSQAQRSQLQAVLPSSPNNVAIGPNGLIYTVTTGLQSQVIKRLNFSGANLLPSTMVSPSFTAGITVDQNGDIFAVDSLTGYIYEYDRDGNLLSIFAGSDFGNQQMGLLKTPVAVAVGTGGKLYVLDKDRGNIQIYQPTEFTQLVHQALSLYLNGRYISSIRPWTQVLRLNSMFDLAHVGIGMAYYKEGSYSAALHQFKIAQYKLGYSNAYWELRRRWLMKYASSVLMYLIGFMVIWSIIKRLHKRFGFGRVVVDGLTKFKRLKLVSEFLHVFRVMRHPIDGFYEIKAEGKTSLWSTDLLFLALLVVHVAVIYMTNFLFMNVNLQSISLLTELLQVIIPVFAWVIVNYLVSAIHDGEGRFRDVYAGTIYALGPYIVFSIPIAILSVGLTNNEVVLYEFLRYGVFLWSGMLMYIMVKEIHGYEIGETFRNILISLLGILILIVLAFILFGLSTQVIDFVHSIFEEVILRVQGQ